MWPVLQRTARAGLPFRAATSPVMPPKSARQLQKAAKATEAVRSVTSSAARDMVQTWMNDHPDKIPELALYLANGGLASKAQAKCPGEMSRGTLHLTDLPKQWLADLLGNLEESIPKAFLAKVYEANPGMLFSLFKMSMNIPNDPNGRPIRIAAYFPRNYLGLEATARLRYEFFGHRLRALASFAKAQHNQWSVTECATKEFMMTRQWDRLGIFRLQKISGEGAPAHWAVMHPSGLKAVVWAIFCHCDLYAQSA